MLELMIRYKAFGICVLIVGLFITIPKIYKMLQIRGEISGARTEEKVVTDKAMFKSGRGKVYWISWGNADITKPSDLRLNLFKDHWERINIGDRINIIYIGDNQRPYIKEGIFASPGNLILDFVLLGIELGGITIFTALLLRERKTHLQD